MPQSDFLHIIKSRGFLHQCTDEAGLDALLKSGSAVPAYIGFDCTARSLHVGSLLQIMLLRWWQKCGHKPIVLMGGGTTKIGDPSGKDESRPQLTDADIAENMDGIKQVFDKFLTFEKESSLRAFLKKMRGNPSNESSKKLFWIATSALRLLAMTAEKLLPPLPISNNALMVNNDDWLKGIHYIDFLRDYGKHFSVNRMMGMDSVKLRLERDQHLSFLEFNYMILQAYDFVELNRIHGCRVQMGGSDQWGNIVMGVDLNRRLLPEPPNTSDKTLRESISSAYDYVEVNNDKYLFGITSPLMTTASGAKMGKTAAGAVWLNADLCSPYDYWQFWRNTEDADVGKFLKLFTELEVAECERLGAFEGAQINEAKKILATEATALLHGREAAEKAAQTAADTFAGVGVSADLPEVLIAHAELEAGMAAYKLFFAAGLAESGGKARKLIEGKGARMNDMVVEDGDMMVSLADMNADGFIKLSSGKKKHVLVKAE